MFLKFYSNSETDKFLILTENKGKAGIYQWTHKESGKSYIGSAIDLSKRLRIYYSPLSLERVDNYISRALICHSHSAFSLTILEYINIIDLPEDEAKTLILEREQHYLDSLLPEYNILKKAGNNLGYRHLEETLLKLSEVNLGENNPMYGKTHSVETLALMSQVKSGENHPMFGKTHSAETKALMSEVKLGENHPMFGKNHSAETLLKMSEAKGSKIQVINKETNETIIYFSNCKAAEALDCSEATIRNYLKNKKLYKGKYLFLKDSVQ